MLEVCPSERKSHTVRATDDLEGKAGCVPHGSRSGKLFVRSARAMSCSSLRHAAEDKNNEYDTYRDAGTVFSSYGRSLDNLRGTLADEAEKTDSKLEVEDCPSPTLGAPPCPMGSGRSHRIIQFMLGGLDSACWGLAVTLPVQLAAPPLSVTWRRGGHRCTEYVYLGNGRRASEVVSEV